MKTLVALLFLPLCAFAALSPGEAESLAAGARGLPAEFAADALIRISTLDVLERTQRVAFLAEAFQQARKAQQPYRMRVAITAMPGPAVFLNKVNGQEMDALDLELRAVEAMLPLDAGRARQLFQSIPPVKLPVVKCDDFMVYDVDRFYRVLAAAAASFPGPDAEAGAPARFVKPYAAVTSAVQVGPMATVLAGTSWSDADFSTVLDAFTGALGKVAGDDRSFTASYRAGPRIEALVKECQRRKVSPLPLIEAYRLFLVVHLSADRCADDDMMQGASMTPSVVTGVEPPVADVAAFFNEHLRMAPLQPIQEGESTPARLEGAATGLRRCASEQCGDIDERYRRLVFGAGNLPVSLEDRKTPDWRQRLHELLDAMAAWKADAHSTAAEHYREKTLLYGDLLNLVPAGETRDAVLQAELAYIVASRGQAASRIEWFLPLNALVGRTSLDPLGFGALRAELRKSSDPVVALYARLEEVAPRSADRLIGLL